MLNIHPAPKPTNEPAPLLVDLATAARMLSIGERTLQKRSNCGEIPVVKIGTSVRYAVADLQDFIDRNRSTPRPTSVTPLAPPALEKPTGDSLEVVARRA